MPFFAPAVTTEADAQLTFLSQQCLQLKYTAFGLTDEQARSTPSASSLCINGLVIHVAQVVYGWLQQLKDPEREIGFDDYPAINAEIGIDGLFDGSQVSDLDIAEVIVRLDRAMAEIEVVRELAAAGQVDLNSVVAKIGNPWMPQDFVMSHRWILVHLNTEVARHVGHADIIRESIDGAIAYELNAKAEGQPWPPAEWSDAEWS